MGNADRIYSEVERKKKRASELKLPETVFNFYHELARWYPAWVKHRPEAIPESVREPTKTGDGSISFSVKNDQFDFRWRESSFGLPDGDVAWSGHLELSFNKKRVFEISLIGSFSEIHGVNWSPTKVEAFVEADWVPTILKLAEEGAETNARAERLATQHAKEDPKRLADLRERFGIESGAAECQRKEKGRSPEGGTRAISWWKRFFRGN
ncbi:MAG: hypothetical protein ABSD47_20915 [Candidatus Methylomirabilota bacterium]|jgi:arylsulfatase A-like enzyme